MEIHENFLKQADVFIVDRDHNMIYSTKADSVLLEYDYTSFPIKEWSLICKGTADFKISELFVPVDISDEELMDLLGVRNGRTN